AGAFNLGLLMRHTIGRGTPRGLQGRRRGCFALSLVVGWLVATLRTTLAPSFAGSRSLGRVGLPRFALAATGRPQCFSPRAASASDGVGDSVGALREVRERVAG